MEGKNRLWRSYLQFYSLLSATTSIYFLFFFPLTYYRPELSVLRAEEMGKIKQGGPHKDSCFRKTKIYLMKTYLNADSQTHLLPCPYLVIRKFEMEEEGAVSYRINQGYV